MRSRAIGSCIGECRGAERSPYTGSESRWIPAFAGMTGWGERGFEKYRAQHYRHSRERGIQRLSYKSARHSPIRP
ncbi:hypothetical protein [Lysobacter gummosus]|uniref:hypothetical protein n=1 Tax=Lysobacter gummosus TaxID=262324 RepID=UPI003624C2D7